jgi:hypothetical protein
VGEWRTDGEQASETTVAGRSSAKEHGTHPDFREGMGSLKLAYHGHYLWKKKKEKNK